MPNSDHATEEPPDLPVLQHPMPSLSISLKCLSRVQCLRSTSALGSGEVYTLSALADASRHGMLHFQVHVHTAPKPALSVRFFGVEGTPMNGCVAAWDLGASGWRGVWVMKPIKCGQRPVFTFTASLAPDRDQNQNRDQNMHGFDPLLVPVSPGLDGGALDVPPELPPRFEGKVVWTVSSWDSAGECRFAFLQG